MRNSFPRLIRKYWGWQGKGGFLLSKRASLGQGGLGGKSLSVLLSEFCVLSQRR